LKLAVEVFGLAVLRLGARNAQSATENTIASQLKPNPLLKVHPSKIVA
jgi:hypothetical protein